MSEIKNCIVAPGSEDWERLAASAENRSWRAGAFLAKDMRRGAFTGWECVFAAMDGEKIYRKEI